MAQQRGDLPVAGDLAARDLLDDEIDALEKGWLHVRIVHSVGAGGNLVHAPGVWLMAWGVGSRRAEEPLRGSGRVGERERVQTGAAAEPTNSARPAPPTQSLHAFGQVTDSQDNEAEHHQPERES
jgi:hypothetical protein